MALALGKCAAPLNQGASHDIVIGTVLIAQGLVVFALHFTFRCSKSSHSTRIKPRLSQAPCTTLDGGASTIGPGKSTGSTLHDLGNVAAFLERSYTCGVI